MKTYEIFSILFRRSTSICRSARTRSTFNRMASTIETTNGTDVANAAQPPPAIDPPLQYKVVAKCGTTKARVGIMTLRHGDVDTPVFMPVGTQGTMKGLLPEQLYNMDCRIILANTYHLGIRPVSHFNTCNNNEIERV